MKTTCPHCGSKNTERTKESKKPYVIAWFLGVFALICLIVFIDLGWWVAAIVDIVFIVGAIGYFDQQKGKKKKKFYICNDCKNTFEK